MHEMIKVDRLNQLNEPYLLFTETMIERDMIVS